MDIGALLKRIKQGDEAAFADIVRHFERPLFGYLGRMGLPQGPAEEVAQEAFLRAWLHLAEYDGARAGFSTWLFTIARNLALNELARDAGKREQLSRDALPEQASGAAGPAELLQEARRRRRLHSALHALPLLDRSALALAYLRELDIPAVARIEGCTTGAVKVRMHRAKQRLRELLGDCDE